MRPKVRFFLIQSLAILAASQFRQAKAQQPLQTADDYAIILLDQTSSMRDQGQTTGKMKWDDAIDAAVNWVDKDATDASNEITSKIHAYAVWTFATEFTPDLTQIVRTGAIQVWPKQASDCNVVTQFEQTTATASFCKFSAAVDTQDFAHLHARFNTDVNGVQSMREHERPGVLNDTPLAESICQTINLFSRLPNTICG